jgi:hypothetical protein
MDIESALGGVRQLRDAVRERNPPPEEGAPSPDEPVIFFSLVRNSRGYIERVVHQINGAYAGGWYDACAVMIRRLIETLIIEAFEEHKIADRIKTPKGDFFFLGDLINSALGEQSWTLGKNARRALPKLKDVGDQSAHSRRFNAQRQDIDKLMSDLRIVVQELVVLARLK